MDSEATTSSVEADAKKQYKIFVNTEEKTVESNIVSYEQVVLLAFPAPPVPTVYSVTYEKAEKPKEGDLLAGQRVEIKEGTEFDVTPTGKS